MYHSGTGMPRGYSRGTQGTTGVLEGYLVSGVVAGGGVVAGHCWVVAGYSRGTQAVLGILERSRAVLQRFSSGTRGTLAVLYGYSRGTQAVL